MEQQKSMQHPPQLHSEILKHITGLENVHCTVTDPGKVRKFYTKLFGSPQNQDGSWPEYKIAGLDFAVTFGSQPKFVVTFTVGEIESLRSKLENEIRTKVAIKHGDYGNYIEICPEEGFCIHFFEPKKNCDNTKV